MITENLHANHITQNVHYDMMHQNVKLLSERILQVIYWTFHQTTIIIVDDDDMVGSETEILYTLV